MVILNKVKFDIILYSVINTAIYVWSSDFLSFAFINILIFVSLGNLEISNNYLLTNSKDINEALSNIRSLVTKMYIFLSCKIGIYFSFFKGEQEDWSSSVPWTLP